MRWAVRAVLVTFLAIYQLDDVFSKSNIIREPRLKSSQKRKYLLKKCVNCMKAFTLGRPGLRFNNSEYKYAVVSLILKICDILGKGGCSLTEEVHIINKN